MDGNKRPLALLPDIRWWWWWWRWLWYVQGTAVFDFNGTTPEVYGNCNAPRAVTLSAIIYCLRCMVGHDVPLNQVFSFHTSVVGGNIAQSKTVNCCDVLFVLYSSFIFYCCVVLYVILYSCFLQWFEVLGGLITADCCDVIYRSYCFTLTIFWFFALTGNRFKPSSIVCMKLVGSEVQLADTPFTHTWDSFRGSHLVRSSVLLRVGGWVGSSDK